MRVRTHTAISLVLVAMSTVGLSVAGPVSASAKTRESKSASDEYGLDVEALQWTPCDKQGLECATLRVPVDYNEPESPYFSIAVVRLPARSAQQRLGSLVINNGGPGGSPVSFIESLVDVPDAFSDEIRDSFDIVGFDPRGVVRTNELTCAPKSPSAAAFQAEAGEPFQLPPEVREQLLRVSREIATACVEQEDPQFLANVTTANVATDMDVLREALGDEKLTYLGLSYGTFLGATYAALFPEDVRALALDAAVPASQYVFDPLRTNLEQGASANQILLDIFEFCAASGPLCPFGGGDPLGRFRTLVDELDKNPAVVTIGGVQQTINGFALTIAVRGFMSSTPRSWPTLLDGLAAVDNGNFEPLFTGGPSRRNFTPAALLITQCNDQEYPDDPEAWDELLQQRLDVSPDFFVLNVFALVECAFLDTGADPYQGPFHSAGTPPILVIGGTRDSQTPYAWSQALTAELGNARLLTFDGYGHVSYRPENGCIRAYVDNYLIDGTLPDEGTVCTQAAPTLERAT